VSRLREERKDRAPQPGIPGEERSSNPELSAVSGRE